VRHELFAFNLLFLL